VQVIASETFDGQIESLSCAAVAALWCCTLLGESVCRPGLVRRSSRPAWMYPACSLTRVHNLGSSQRFRADLAVMCPGAPGELAGSRQGHAGQPSWITRRCGARLCPWSTVPGSVRSSAHASS
jgi:hypothetical protein